MSYKFIFTTIVVVTFFLFIFQSKINGQTISTKEADELRAFLKENMGNFVPDDATIEVSGYEKTPLSGFKQGRFKVTTSKGSGDVPFLISEDGKYLIFGEPVDTRTFKDLPLGIKEGKIQIGAGPPIPVAMSKDGRYLILGGELIDLKSKPTK
jgi:hypothetical protein